ncbi:EamA family transporter [Sulfitobacter sp. JBTF-M27]|uniref:EamA family transporter n=1 Tax=Sulfitobacter sediminilitoris TaxID=2698830 RepID=A0A6P0CJS8_9RHOB|nr:DMT family transporter [Sulfitobacter sediminilitoris]NEK25235.1 EamA family transporter [Sulfitobacter sediminilitoris]
MIDVPKVPAIPTGSVALAIGLSLLSLVFFDLMGLIIKRLSADYSAAELSAYRNFFGLIPSAIALWSSRSWHDGGRRLRVRQWTLIGARGLIVTLAQLMFYLSLGRIAFASATTISYSSGLFMTAFAVLLLGERVGIIRWIAVVIGFVGVVMVMGPGRDTFTFDSLLPLAAAALYALTGVTARLIDDDVPSALINLYSTGFAVLGSVVLALLLGGFSPIQNASDFAWIIAMGVSGGIAVLLLVISFRMTEQSNLAPFSYLGIPMAFVFGWMFFGEAPWQDLFPGAILIVIGGLLVVWRERRRTRLV